jgi:hypothetical protein
MALLVTLERGDAGDTITLECERFDHKIQRMPHLSPVQKFASSGEEAPYVSDWGAFEEFFYLHAVFTTGTAYDAFRAKVKNYWRNKGVELKIGEAAEVDYIVESDTVFISMDGSHDAGINEWNVILALGVVQYKT